MIVDVERAARAIEQGLVVAYPTETVYGLGVDARSRDALARLNALKGRSEPQAVSLLVAGFDAVERIAPSVPAAARRLAERFWPGPLTLVVPVDAAQFVGVRSSRGVGFRCSSDPTARALLQALAHEIVSTSCNRSGEQPCTTADEVESTFGSDLRVAGGGAAGGQAPSTVVALDASGGIELLREGALPWAELVEQGVT